MDSIELMVDEHRYIKRMLKVMRKAAYKVLLGEEICYEDFDEIIDFVRNYADNHHHGKEEKILFKEMLDNLGEIGVNLITHGMLVEHDWGRLFIGELKEALNKVKNGDEESRLDVIANSVSYANHLLRHIKKEDEVVYTFAARQLKSIVLERINSETETFEEQAKGKGTQDKYIKILEKLESKYLD